MSAIASSEAHEIWDITPLRVEFARLLSTCRRQDITRRQMVLVSDRSLNLTYSYIGMYNGRMARASTTSDPFNAIAEPRRRHILEFIAGDERSVTDIADALELGQPSVSKHLQVLRDVGLVSVRRDGRRTMYRINADTLRTVHDWSGMFARLLARTAATHQGTRRGGAMTTMAPVSETFTITEEILVRATLDKTFASLIAQMGRLNETPDGKPLPMVLEPHPGGRWFRDLGGDNGHLWGFVQSIKRPVLLEIWGPLFMSTAATSNLLYRLTEVEGGSLITFTHTLVGPFPEDHRPQLGTGWAALHARVRKAAETNGRE